MPYGSVTAQGLFKLADMNMENRRLEQQDKQQGIENQFKLGQEARLVNQENRLQQDHETQRKQAQDNLQLLNTTKEFDGHLAQAAAGAKPDQAFSLMWDKTGELAKDPKYAPIALKKREELLDHTTKQLAVYDKLDPTGKRSIQFFNATIGKANGEVIEYVEKTKDGEITYGTKTVNGEPVKAIIFHSKDGLVKDITSSFPEEFTPAGKDGEQEKWTTFRDVMRNGKPTAIERSNLGNERVVGDEAPPKPGQQINIGADKQEMALFEPLLKDLPNRQGEAALAGKAIARIDRSLDLIDKHGDSITGVSGAIKRTLAPYATTVGLNTAEMDDSQILTSLLTEGQGSLRMEVIGPGPVAIYEQKILEQVSGKKISAAEGVKKLLEAARENKASYIQNYNEQVEAISSEPGYEKARKIYKPVVIKERKSGNQIGKMSDSDLLKALNGN